MNRLWKSVLVDLSAIGPDWSGWMIFFLNRQVWGQHSFRSWASESVSCEPGDAQLPLNVFFQVSLRCLPLLSDSVDPDSSLDVVSNVLKNRREKGSVSRGLKFICYSFLLSFHYHPVGRRLSFCSGTHSLHTVGKSLNKKTLFYNR